MYFKLQMKSVLVFAILAACGMADFQVRPYVRLHIYFAGIY
jgi:hypothetical protein